MNTASLAKCVEDDSYYERVQAEHNDVSAFWAEKALLAAKNFIEILGPSLFDDDVVADFGSRTGYVAELLKRMLYIKTICVDISQESIAACEKLGFEGICARLEHLPMADGSVDWGFCSHTLEHVKDMDAAVGELTRVVKRGLFLVFPLEDADNTDKNPSHMRYSTDPNFYIAPFEARGWKRGWYCPPIFKDEPRESRSDYQVWLYR